MVRSQRAVLAYMVDGSACAAHAMETTADETFDPRVTGSSERFIRKESLAESVDRMAGFS